MEHNQYDTNLAPCEQNRANCNRAREMKVRDEDGNEVSKVFCEVLQNTTFKRPCPFFKERGKK